MNLLTAIRSAFGYFTILPVGRSEYAPIAAALAALPLVGVCIGAMAGGFALAISPHVSHSLVVAIAFACAIVLTGAIHVDGFLDGCDALFASVSIEQRLRILDDPRHGTFAVAGGAVAAVLWLGAVWSCPVVELPMLLGLSGGFARLLAVIHAWASSHANAGTATRSMVLAPSRGAVLGIALQGVALVLWASVWQGGARATVLLVPAAALSVAIAAFARKRLGGGLTGDAYGFLIVICEIVVLIAGNIAQTR